jgi:DNA-binding CsgD family transcriptional regulator
VLAGRSRVTVVRGEAGVGKSALLGYLSGKAGGWHIARAAGVESEMELAFSGLHQLCAPMLDYLERLPVPQREALATAFGRSAGPAPDRFLVGLATLSLFAEVAERQPLACIIDDAQWLDDASAQVLAFVSRRLLAERIAVVCAARSGIGDDVLAGLPELRIDGLAADDARALLLGNVHGPLDAVVCDQIIEESRGNPLALLELPRTWSNVDLAGGFGPPDRLPVAGRVERSYVRRLLRLPPGTQLLVLAAAAEPLGDPVLLHRATAILGLDMSEANLAEDAGLLTIGMRVVFAHPLARSAVYRAAAADDRHRVHQALADATDPEADPDRHAWHRARSVPGPDEDAAAGLERSARRAQARGGLAAAAAFLQRAVALSAEPGRRSARALAAAQASFQAGAFDMALGLLATAQAGSLDDAGSAQADLLRGHIASASGASDAAALLRKAARQLERLDLALARETYLNAWAAAVYAGHVAGADELLAICHAAQALPPPADPRPVDMLLDGLARLITDGRAAAAPALLRVGRTFAGGDMTAEEIQRWAWLATSASTNVWDDDVTTRAIAARVVQLARDAGALAQLPIALAVLGTVTAWSGDFAGTAALIAETDSVAAASEIRFPSFIGLRLLALQGREAEASMLIARTIEQAAGGQGISATNAHWAAAVLYNGLGRYEQAATAARQATSAPFLLYGAMWALPELVEAATRAGDTGLARDALERLREETLPCGTEVALGIEARCGALLSDGPAAGHLYRQAVDRLSRTGLRTELARAHLLYGEWLRREGQRLQAREQLRTAHDMLAAIGMEAFAERARRELLATGEKLRKRSDETREELTPQEEQIARLARDGHSNREIGAMLFLSPRTVEWHLRKAFTKLGITSRNALHAALAAREAASPG